MWRGLEGGCNCQGQSHPDATTQGGSLGVKTTGLSGLSSLIISENFPSARPLDVSGRGILLTSRVGRLPEAVSTADGRQEGKCSLFISLFY